MPKYDFHLKNGKTLTLEGDTQPSDAEVESIAKEQGVELLPAGGNTAPTEKPQGFLSKAYHGIMDPIMTPLTDAPSRWAHQAADFMTDPNNAIFKPTGDPIRDRIARIAAQTTGFFAGVGEGMGDVATSMTAPGSLAAIAATGGGALAGRAGLAGTAGALSAIGRLSSVPNIVHGGVETLRPDASLAERGMGLAELAGGIAGAKHTPEIRTTKPADVGIAPATPSQQSQMPPGWQTVDTNIGPKLPVKPPTAPMGQTIVISEAKATPEMVKKAREQGFEFQGVNDRGDFRFKKTSEGTQQPVLEMEVGNKRARPSSPTTQPNLLDSRITGLPPEELPRRPLEIPEVEGAVGRNPQADLRAQAERYGVPYNEYVDSLRKDVDFRMPSDDLPRGGAGEIDLPLREPGLGNTDAAMRASGLTKEELNAGRRESSVKMQRDTASEMADENPFEPLTEAKSKFGENIDAQEVPSRLPVKSAEPAAPVSKEGWFTEENLKHIDEGKNPYTGEYSETPSPAEVAVRASKTALEDYKAQNKGNMDWEKFRKLKSQHNKNVDALIDEHESTSIAKEGGSPEVVPGADISLQNPSPAKIKSLESQGYVKGETLPDGSVTMKYGKNVTPSGSRPGTPTGDRAIRGNQPPTGPNGPSGGGPSGPKGPSQGGTLPGRKEPTPPEKPSLYQELTAGFRTAMTGFDLSAPLRQGLGLIHKKKFWTQALPAMFKSAATQAGYDAVMSGIKEKPLFRPRMKNGKVIPSFAEEAGVSMTDLTTLNTREEAIASKIIGNLPGFKQSNRAYTAFLNKLRADTFEDLIAKGKIFGANGETNVPLAREIAKFVNTATGRGSLGKLEGSAAKALANTFFAPRLVASRLQMLNPHYYWAADPFVRKEALKSLFAIASVGTTVGQLARLGGATVEPNPTSADFGKIKIGDTRIDLYGGYQQYITAAARLLSGHMKSSTSGREYTLGEKFGRPTRLDMAGRFVESKLNPVYSFIIDMLRGKNMAGQPFDVPEALAERMVPMFLQDLKAVSTENPDLLSLPDDFFPENTLMAIPSLFGAGLQQYEGRSQP